MNSNPFIQKYSIRGKNEQALPMGNEYPIFITPQNGEHFISV
jgi:hypothetical protein